MTDNGILKEKAYAAIGALSWNRPEALFDLFQRLEAKDADTFYHSLRVGMLTDQIACLFGIGSDNLLVAGYLHDIGKLLIPAKLLSKKTVWTDSDAKIMENHVMAGYEILADNGFADSADIMALHHRFQKTCYPKNVPLPRTSNDREINYIACCGRILALADCFDALHRINSRFKGEALNGLEIREKMLELNSDQEIMIDILYETGIFR